MDVVEEEGGGRGVLISWATLATREGRFGGNEGEGGKRVRYCDGVLRESRFSSCEWGEVGRGRDQRCGANVR